MVIMKPILPLLLVVLLDQQMVVNSAEGEDVSVLSMHRPRHLVRPRQPSLETPKQQESHSQLHSQPPPQQRRQRGGELYQEAQVAALYQGNQDHYVDIYCGTPPQRQSVMVSTGAHETIFPCTGCHTCGVDDAALFAPEHSMTFGYLSCSECQVGICVDNNNQCHVEEHINGRSRWEAIEAADYCYLGGLHDKPVTGQSDIPTDPEHAAQLTFRLAFGCQTVVTGVFVKHPADGTLAMDNSPTSFWSQMYNAGKIPQASFSLCFGRQVRADRSATQAAGVLTLGGIEERLHLHPIVYSKISSDHDSNHQFAVHLRRVYLRAGGGGDFVLAETQNLTIVKLDVEESKLNEGPVVIESGYASTYFTPNMFGAFRQAWTHLTRSDYITMPRYTTYDEMQALPTILIQLEGLESFNQKLGDRRHVVGLAGELDPEHPWDVLVAIPPSHYMEYDDDKGEYVSHLELNTNHYNLNTILGSNTIMGHDVVFDSQNHRIGWAESHCDYASLIDSDPSYIPTYPDYSAFSENEQDQHLSLFGKTGWFILLASTICFTAYMLSKRLTKLGHYQFQRFAHRSPFSHVLEENDGSSSVIELELQPTRQT